MQAWICNELSGPDALTWQDSPTPEPGPGEVRVAIKAASLNFPDLLIVQGKYQMKPPLPFVPGAEFAGVVEAVGEGVKHLSVGSHVAGFGGTGGFGTHTISKAAVLMPLPPAFSFEDGAAFLCTYGTTYHGLMDRGALKAGETVLVLGAAGGVGTAAIQIAKAAGAKVIAAASTDEKCALCKELGADATINYSTQNLRDELKTLTEGKGPDVIYDPVGGDLTEQAFRSIGWRGRLLVVGEFARREPQNNAACLMQLAAWYMEGKIKPVIEHKLPMSQLKEAFALMGTRQVRGKVVLVNS
mgnify:CR=1 FL=1